MKRQEIWQKQEQKLQQEREELILRAQREKEVRQQKLREERLAEEKRQADEMVRAYWERRVADANFLR